MDVKSRKEIQHFLFYWRICGTTHLRQVLFYTETSIIGEDNLGAGGAGVINDT